MTTPTRPACLEFALDFLGGTEAAELRSYIEALEARAALAQPEPVVPTDEELIRVYQAAYQPAWDRGEFHGCHVDGLRAVANLACSTPQPIPVSERLPGAKDCAPWPDEPDCDPWCWAAKDIDGGWEWTQLGIGHFSSDLEWVWCKRGYTHWLPHHALPLPAAPGQGE